MFMNQSFVLYHDNGKVEIIAEGDLYDYVWRTGGINRFYGAMKFNLGAYKKKVSQSYGSYFSPAFEHDEGFFCYTSTGKMVSPDLFLGEFKEYERQKWARYYDHKSKRQYKPSHNTRIRKRMHNVPAQRASVGVVREEGEPNFRGARTKGTMPNYWDDYYSRASCSWKNCTKRKRQYKGS